MGVRPTRVLHALDEMPDNEHSGIDSELDEGRISDRSDLFEVPRREVLVSMSPEDDYEPSLLQFEEQESAEVRARDEGGELLVEDVAPHEEFEEAGSKRMALFVPRGPSPEERREHEISHLPYRSWCRDCIRGKGLTLAHKRRLKSDEEKGQRRPMIAMDYFFLGKEEEQSLPILGMVEEQTGRTYVLCMPEKGTGHQYNIAATGKMLRISGCLGGILKSDNERSLVALRTRLQEMFPSLGCEDATKGESQSNGLIESYIGKIEAQARTLKSALDRHYPGLHVRHPVLPWLVDYAGVLLSRYNRGADGFTPFERSTGKKWQVQLPEFGETVWFQPLKGERAKGKLEAKFEEGIYLGVQEGSTMKWIGTTSGVQRAWTVKCRPEEERWNRDLMQNLIGLPWQLKPRSEQMERPILPARIEVALPEVPADEKEEEKNESKKRKPYVPRGIYIRRHIELEEFGFTEGCDGCMAARHGLSHKQHSTACKNRIREEMMKTEQGRKKVERMERRAEEFSVRHQEQEEKAKAEKRKSETVEEERDPKLLRGVDDVLLEELESLRSQEGIALPSSSSRGPSLAPLPAEELASRGAMGGSGDQMEDDDERGTMALGSLEAFCYRGSGAFCDAVREADFTEVQAQLEDEFIEAQRLKLQLGHISLHEAYGIDPTGKRPTVVEVFSPPRLTAYGMRKGLIGGVALDLTTADENGVPWDFSKADRRAAAKELIDLLQPELLLGCPPCGPYSILQGLNQHRADPAQAAQKLKQAKEHLDFCCELYEEQAARKKFFVHEHPDGARSWSEESVKRVESLPFVVRVRGDMCRHGMESSDEHGSGAVRKPTGFMTNSKCIARELSLLCENRPNELKVWKRLDLNASRTQMCKKGGPEKSQIVRRVTVDIDRGEVVQDLRDFQQAQRSQLHMVLPKGVNNIATFFYYKEVGSKWHRHVQLINGRAKKAEIYPDGLLHHILKGLKSEMKKKFPLGSLEFGPVNEEPMFDSAVLEQEDWSTFVDEVSGKALETSMVKAAREEEIDYAHRYNVWTLAPISEAWERTGKAPISSRWIDINKGDEERPAYRSRLVIQEIRQDGVESIFAATPPLESIRFLLSLQRSRVGYKIMFIDIRRAHWTAKIDRLVYVRLPPEAAEEGYCGRLNKAMYGCRDAARQWEAEITDFFTANGFTPGLGSPVLFCHVLRDVKISVHGDDITALGKQADLLWLKEQLLTRYEIKYGGMLGPDKDDVQDAMILNRLVHFGEFETTIEADPRHVQILINELNLQDAKGSPTPGVRRENSESEPLTADECRRYRSLVMRGCYLSLDRPDISFACKELARSMSSPMKADWNGLKRLGRFLKQEPRLVWRYPDQVEQMYLTMYSDSDDAGCSKTRKSTSSGALLHGSHLIKFYSSTQHVISLSSGESEFYAGVKAGSVLLGAMSMAMDLGETKKGQLCFDATAAKAMLSRKGHGRAKHIDRSYLWLQQRVQSEEIELSKVGTRKNIADLGTKHLDRNQIEVLCKEMNLEWAESTHKLSLNV